MAAEAKVTAKALASELGWTGKKLRRHLRKEFGTDHTKGERWEMDRAEADTIKAALLKPKPAKVEEPVEA